MRWQLLLVASWLRNSSALHDASTCDVCGSYEPLDCSSCPSDTITLDINGRSVQSLPAGAFSSLTSLAKLVINEPGLSSIDSDAFGGCNESLTTLHLYTSDLTAIPSRALSNLPRVRRLYIQNSLITSLPSKSFAGMRDLTYLDLSRNKLLHTIQANAFSGLDNVTHLFLGANAIVNLDPDAFSGLPKLKYLVLAPGMPLHAIPDEAFKSTHLPSLRYLTLPACQASALGCMPAGALANMKTYSTQPTLGVTIRYINDENLHGNFHSGIDTNQGANRQRTTKDIAQVAMRGGYNAGSHWHAPFDYTWHAF